MAHESLGSTIRHTLLKYAFLEKISIWDFSELDAISMTVLSSGRMLCAVVVTLIVTACSLAFIILRKREFTQKDTLCAFVFMVVSIFLLESVQKMLKLELSLDKSYKDISVSIPFSSLLVNTPANRHRVCTNELNDKLEKTADEIRFGERASAAYTNLVRENILKKRPPAPGPMSPIQSNTINTVPTAEYCLFKQSSTPKKRKNCPECKYLADAEFNEAKGDLKYIDSVNKEYQEIERSITLSKKQYKQYSVELMRNFKEFNRVSYYARDELNMIGVDFNVIEHAILALVNKYESMFTMPPRRRTRLKVENNSVCVSIDNAPFNMAVRPAQNISKPIQKKTITVIEKKTYSPARALIMASGLASSDSDRSIASGIQDMVQSNATIPSGYSDTGRETDRRRDPFFSAMFYSLTMTEVLIFMQVLLVMGVIISIIFDRKWLYFVFYCCMCGSLIISLFFGFVAFVHSTALSSLCKNGLQCDAQVALVRSPSKPLKNLIDLPEMVLKESIATSTNNLEKQINRVLTSNTSEEIQTIAGQLDRLFQIKKDFINLVSTNPNKTLISKKAIYHSADTMNQTLNRIKALDKQIRDNQWTETFKKLSEVNVLLTETGDKDNMKKRKVLSKISNAEESPIDMSSCAGKEMAVCDLKKRFDSLFVGLSLFSVVLSVLIAI